MGLHEKIYNVMNESEGLEKDLVVGSGSSSYKAVGEKEVLNMLKPLFKKHKLIIYPIDGEISEQNSTFESEYNGKTTIKARNVTQLKVKFKIVDVETGESDILIGFGNGADSQDKGSGKAFTYAFKTALSKTFMLFSGEDTDNTHSDDIGKPTEEEKLAKQKIDKVKLATLEAMLLKTETDKEKYLEFYKLDKLENMTNGLFARAMKALENKLPKEGKQ